MLGVGTVGPGSDRIGTFGPARRRDGRRSVEPEVVEVTSQLARAEVLWVRHSAREKVDQDAVVRSAT